MAQNKKVLNTSKQKEQLSYLMRVLLSLKTSLTPVKHEMRDLQPLVKRQAQKVIEDMKMLGHPIRITEGYRSPERQAQLYAQGRTAPGSIVTNAKAGQSFHNYGVAVDCVFQKEGYNASEALWQTLGAIGKKHGFEWGGDWKGFKDRPHLEMKMGYTLAAFQQGLVDYNKFK